MAINVTFNGTAYSFPENREPKGWGASLSAFLVDVGGAALSKAGGTFTLTADIDFGATYGIKSAYYSSRNTSPAAAGQVRLGNTETLQWRDQADGADLPLTADANDNLTYNALTVPTVTTGGDSTKKVAFTADGATTAKALTIDTNHTDDRTWTIPDATDTSVGKATTDTLTNKSIDADNNTLTNIVNAGIKAAAAIDLNKLAATTASRALVSDGSGFVSVATTTAAELEYVNGVTSAIQTQMDLKAPLASPTLTTPTLTSPVINTAISGTAFLDEDNMSSDSAVKVASQQSIKAYVDAVSASLGNVAYSAKSADYTVLDADGFRTIGMTVGSSTDKTVTLPTASANTNRIITIKKVDSGTNDLIIDGEGAETIDGATTLTIPRENDSYTLQCDGSNWEILSAQIGEATADTAGLVKKVKYANNVLGTLVSATSTDITDLKFSNLTVGNVYRVNLHAYVTTTGSSSTESIELFVKNNSVLLITLVARKDSGAADTRATSHHGTAIFVAAATTVVFSIDIAGTGSLAATNTITTLEDITSTHIVTTEW
tara:strand:- start:10959 stop:12599 length:1641 start_codon:yes stop_codon:yes gene_type:complete